jgi:hypothetical protein
MKKLVGLIGIIAVIALTGCICQNSSEPVSAPLSSDIKADTTSK